MERFSFCIISGQRGLPHISQCYWHWSAQSDLTDKRPDLCGWDNSCVISGKCCLEFAIVLSNLQLFSLSCCCVFLFSCSFCTPWPLYKIPLPQHWQGWRCPDFLSKDQFSVTTWLETVICLPKIPSGLTLTNVEPLSQTAVVGLSSFSPVTSTPCPPPPDMMVSQTCIVETSEWYEWDFQILIYQWFAERLTANILSWWLDDTIFHGRHNLCVRTTGFVE